MDIAIALSYLRPGEEWVLDGNDYENLVWVSDTKKPTLKQIEAVYDAALAEREAAEEAKLAAKESARTKLAALGLTEEEVLALIG